MVKSTKNIAVSNPATLGSSLVSWAAAAKEEPLAQERRSANLHVSLVPLLDKLGQLVQAVDPLEVGLHNGLHQGVVAPVARLLVARAAVVTKAAAAVACAQPRAEGHAALLHVAHLEGPLLVVRHASHREVERGGPLRCASCDWCARVNRGCHSGAVDEHPQLSRVWLTGGGLTWGFPDWPTQQLYSPPAPRQMDQRFAQSRSAENAGSNHNVRVEVKPLDKERRVLEYVTTKLTRTNSTCSWRAFQQREATITTQGAGDDPIGLQQVFPASASSFLLRELDRELSAKHSEL
ncbi:hypothetical protein ON010_g16439 [Phytophthora cinnamomi]|nr:hypothetical protein ON010_g16439 [Phytophthora cinnamomi]